MDEYVILFARSARKELEALSAQIQTRIMRRIEALATVPRSAGCKKLVGSTNLWRLRVGDYRVLYAIDDDRTIVDVIAIRHRRDAYQ